MRTRGNVPRIHTNVNTKTYVLSMNQRIPATQSSSTYAQATSSPTMNRLARTKPMARACQVLMRELAIQNGAAKSSVRTTGTTAMRMSSPIPSDAGSNATLVSNGHGNGAFQPPKNRVTVSADMMNTFTYSAKKK